MDIPELIGEVAKKHNVLLGKSDPIFVTVFLNELVLREQIAHVVKTAERANREAERQALARIDRAREAARAVLTETAERAGETMVRSVQRMYPALEKSLVEAINLAHAGASEAREHRNVALIAAACCVSVVFGLVSGLLFRGHS